MTQRKFLVTEALEKNDDVVKDLMTGAKYVDYAVMRSLKLLHPVTFRKHDYTHVTVNSFLTGDSPLPSRPADIVPFSPALSLMLQAEPSAEVGLVTRVDYGGFGLDAWMHDKLLPRQVGQFLIARSFQVARGSNLDDPERVLGGGELGTPTEAGPIVRIAAETINATSEFVRAVGFTTLAAQHEY